MRILSELIHERMPQDLLREQKAVAEAHGVEVDWMVTDGLHQVRRYVLQKSIEFAKHAKCSAGGGPDVAPTLNRQDAMTWKGTDGKGQMGRDRWEGTDGKGQMGRDRWEGTDGKGQMGRDRWEGTLAAGECAAAAWRGAVSSPRTPVSQIQSQSQ